MVTIIRLIEVLKNIQRENAQNSINHNHNTLNSCSDLRQPTQHHYRSHYMVAVRTVTKIAAVAAAAAVDRRGDKTRIEIANVPTEENNISHNNTMTQATFPLH